MKKAYAPKVYPPSNAIPVPISVKKGSHGTKITHQIVNMVVTVTVSGAGPGNDFSNTVQ